ncbi:hypothetical protein PQX77_008901 [Marasmius sp. AFHP31]|nr:hypothetical protein PQX77_008901 [Marasmius sp. AFHP31]
MPPIRTHLHPHLPQAHPHPDLPMARALQQARLARVRSNLVPQPFEEETIEEKLADLSEKIEEISDGLNKLDDLDDLQSKLEDIETDVCNKLDDLEGSIAEANVTNEVGGISDTVDSIESEVGEIKHEVEEMREMLTLNNAMMYNIKAARNNQFAYENPDWNYEFQLLQKTREGDGVELAIAAFDDTCILPEEVLYSLGVLSADIGSLPSDSYQVQLPVFDPSTIDDCSLALLVVFYNEDFGIRAQDSLDLRRKKWIRWLCT